MGVTLMSDHWASSRTRPPQSKIKSFEESIMCGRKHKTSAHKLHNATLPKQHRSSKSNVKRSSKSTNLMSSGRLSTQAVSILVLEQKRSALMWLRNAPRKSSMRFRQISLVGTCENIH